jgi:hypothetical protein
VYNRAENLCPGSIKMCLVIVLKQSREKYGNTDHRDVSKARKRKYLNPEFGHKRGEVEEKGTKNVH